MRLDIFWARCGRLVNAAGRESRARRDKSRIILAGLLGPRRDPPALLHQVDEPIRYDTIPLIVRDLVASNGVRPRKKDSGLQRISTYSSFKRKSQLGLPLQVDSPRSERVPMTSNLAINPACNFWAGDAVLPSKRQRHFEDQKQQLFEEEVATASEMFGTRTTYSGSPSLKKQSIDNPLLLCGRGGGTTSLALATEIQARSFVYPTHPQRRLPGPRSQSWL